MIIDTHAHLSKELYDNLEQVFFDAKKENIEKIINCSDSIENSIENLNLSNRNKGFLYTAVGIHPENALKTTENDLKELENLIKNNKIVAIGEIGLDFFYSKDKSVKEKQIKIFKYQLDLANKYNLPVIIHSREATEEILNILKSYKLKGIIHCFSGSFETAQRYIKLGYLLGIGGVLTFKNSKLYETIEKIDIKNLVLETDCPFMTPDPFRGQKNEPKYIIYTLKKLSEIKNMSVEKVEEITTQNTLNIFDLS